jgi:hypothetical protein
VDGGVTGDSRREGEQHRERFSIADLADDGNVGSHAQEARDEATQVDLGSVGTGWPRLHLRDVGKRDVGLEHLFCHHDSERRIELGEAAREQCRLPRPGSAGEHHRRARPHAGSEERRHADLDGAQVGELVERADGHAGELPDVDEHVAPAANVGVDDVHA